MASPNDAPKRLTNNNQEIAALALGETERFEWQGPDKFHEDGAIVYPPGFQKDKKYPLVLIIHGGPRAATTTQFSFLPQFVAAHDCVVFEPNYRGSENLGNAYTHAIWDDAGDGPGRDVMAGIEALKKLGFVDESKIAVSGWSPGAIDIHLANRIRREMSTHRVQRGRLHLREVGDGRLFAIAFGASLPKFLPLGKIHQ